MTDMAPQNHRITLLGKGRSAERVILTGNGDRGEADDHGSTFGGRGGRVLNLLGQYN